MTSIITVHYNSPSSVLGIKNYMESIGCEFIEINEGGENITSSFNDVDKAFDAKEKIFIKFKDELNSADGPPIQIHTV